MIKKPIGRRPALAEIFRHSIAAKHAGSIQSQGLRVITIRIPTALQAFELVRRIISARTIGD
jgi:hypothetical protein